jgi:hypothetical protein
MKRAISSVMPRLAKSPGIEIRSLPGGLGLAVLGQRAGRLHLLGHLARMLEQALAELGQHQPARGALQEALAEAGLEQRDAARHRRFRQVQALRRHAETAGLDDAGEQQHVVRFEVHDCSTS